MNLERWGTIIIVIVEVGDRVCYNLQLFCHDLGVFLVFYVFAGKWRSLLLTQFLPDCAQFVGKHCQASKNIALVILDEKVGQI